MKGSDSKYQVLVVNSAKYLTLTTKKYDKRKKWQRDDPNEIKSYIPGSIIEINAKPGQHLKAGEVILILDAMKMYTRVTMPRDGIIKTILVAKGDRISKDFLMATIE